jgi:hypothetical protein
MAKRSFIWIFLSGYSDIKSLPPEKGSFRFYLAECVACFGNSFRTFSFIIYLAKFFLPENSILPFSYSASLEPRPASLREALYLLVHSGRFQLFILLPSVFFICPAQAASRKSARGALTFSCS